MEQKINTQKLIKELPGSLDSNAGVNTEQLLLDLSKAEKIGQHHSDTQAEKTGHFSDTKNTGVTSVQSTSCRKRKGRKLGQEVKSKKAALS